MGYCSKILIPRIVAMTVLLMSAVMNDMTVVSDSRIRGFETSVRLNNHRSHVYFNILSSIVDNCGRPFLKTDYSFALRAKISHDTFVCDSCGVEHIRWVGRCTVCHEWNSVKAFKQGNELSAKNKMSSSLTSNIRQQPALIARIKNRAKDENVGILTTRMNKWVLDSESMGDMLSMDKVDILVANRRIDLFSDEVNRVLGGGLVPGSVILLTGEPGIGKELIRVFGSKRCQA